MVFANLNPDHKPVMQKWLVFWTSKTCCVRLTYGTTKIDTPQQSPLLHSLIVRTSGPSGTGLYGQLVVVMGWPIGFDLKIHFPPFLKISLYFLFSTSCTWYWSQNTTYDLRSTVPFLSPCIAAFFTSQTVFSLWYGRQRRTWQPSLWKRRRI